MRDSNIIIFPCLSKCKVHKVCKGSERCDDYQCELSKWRKDIARTILGSINNETKKRY